MKDNIRAQIQESVRIKNSFSDELVGEIEKCAKKCIECLSEGGKILICGNGGSAADSQHFEAELVSKFRLERKGLPAIALTTNSSLLTAIGNDYGFGKIFSRQVEALGNNNDVLFAISTSGNSENIVEALKESKNKGIFTVGLTGEVGGLMSDFCDLMLRVPAIETPRIQESHIMIIHILCDLIEKSFYEK